MSDPDAAPLSSRRLPARSALFAQLLLATMPLAAALLAAPAAHAAASALIEWDAPEACPGAADVFERLSAALGYEPETLGKLSRVRGNVLPTAGGGYRLSLDVYENGRRSSRALEAPSCEDLVDAAVLAITLALAPAHAQQPESAASDGSELAVTSNTAEAPRSTPSAEPPDAGADTASAGASVPVRGVAAAGIVAELGALPDPALGVTVGVGAEWPKWSLGAYGTLFPSQRLAARPSQYVEFELTVGGLRGCRRWLELPLTLDTCAALEAGRWEAFGVDLLSAQRARELWLAPGAGLGAGYELASGLALQLRADAVAPLTRRRYIVNENEAVHTPDRVSWRFMAGLSLGTR